MKILIDADGAIFGRLCSFVAKKALEGDEVAILNSEKVIITGNKKDIIARYKRIKGLGSSTKKGPNYSRPPFMMLKRGIRGMLPNHREGIGREAFLRIKCHEGIPKEFEGQKATRFATKKPNKFIVLKELSERL